MKSKLIKRLITCLIIGTVVVGSYYGYNSYSTSKSATTANKYVTVTAKKTNMQVGIQGTGSVYAAVSKDVVANNAGVLKNLNIKVGDTVKSGQQLFVADSDDLRRSVTTAQNNLEMQKLTLLNDQNNYNDQLAKANTAVTDAQNKLNDAVQKVNKMTVTAPVGGVIAAANYKNGDNIQMGGSSGNGQVNGSSNNGQPNNGSHNSQPNNSSQNSQVNNNNDSAKIVVLSIEDPKSPEKKISVIPNNSGVLKNLNVKVGDTVKAGQVLFVVDSDTLRNNVTTAQSNLDKQKSALSDIKNSNKIAIDNLAISDAQSQLNDAVQQLNNMTVTAPISGFITVVNNINGDKVDAGSNGGSGQSSSSGSTQSSSSGSGQSSSNGQGGSKSSSGQSNNSDSNSQTSSSSGSTQSGVLTIVDPSTMKVKVEVDELDIAKVKEGQKAEIKFDAIKDKVFDGTVESIAQTGTSSNNVTTYDVVVSITDSSDIKIGMNANVNILVDSKDDALTIPTQALTEKDGKEYVEVPNINGNTTSSTSGSAGSSDNSKLVEVKTGLENENYVEIVDGITEGQKVLINLPKSTSATNTNTNSRNSFSGSGLGGAGFSGFGGGSSGSRQQGGSNGGNRN